MVAAQCEHSIGQHLQSRGVVMDTTEEAVMTAAALSRHPLPASYTQDSSSALSSKSAPTASQATSPAFAPAAAGSNTQGGAGSSRRSSSSSSLPTIPANLPPRLRHLYAVYSDYRESQQQATLAQRGQSQLQGQAPQSSPRPIPQATAGATADGSSLAAERGATTTASAPLSRPLPTAAATTSNAAMTASAASAAGAHAGADAAYATVPDQLRAPVSAAVPIAPQTQGPCLSFAAYCLRYLYRPLLSSNDLLSYDLRLGFAHVPLVVLHRPHGLLLIDLYTAPAFYLQQHLGALTATS